MVLDWGAGRWVWCCGNTSVGWTNRDTLMTANPGTKEQIDNWNYLRPEVQAFATVMEHKLRLNDYKGGWDDCSWEYLWGKLREETRELDNASKQKLQGNNAVTEEAADVANIALMLADMSETLQWMQQHALENQNKVGTDEY